MRSGARRAQDLAERPRSIGGTIASMRTRRADRTWFALACGAVGAPLFVVVFLVEGTRRPDYDPMREPVSSLALGSRGWVLQANFIGTGLLMLACAQGLSRASRGGRAGSRWGPRLVALYAIGLVGAGVFVTYPVGYGRSDPTSPSRTGLQGALHGVFSQQVFAALSAAACVYARWFASRGEPRWAAASAATGAAIPVGIFLFGQALERDARDPLGGRAGLIQRLTIALGWGWLVAPSARFLRGPRG